MNTSTLPLEAETRVLIDRSLENLGWKLSGKDQNVYYEQPRTEAEKKKLGGKRPDYVLYSKESDKPLIVIEATIIFLCSFRRFFRFLICLACARGLKVMGCRYGNC